VGESTPFPTQPEHPSVPRWLQVIDGRGYFAEKLEQLKREP
jgi:hypothetical protein